MISDPSPLPTAVLSTILAGSLSAAPLRVLAIGDSLTEEYAFEPTFSAPASDPDDPNTRSWTELLRTFRGAEVSLGPYENTLASYADLRNSGHEWNFGIPGTTLRNWVNLLNRQPGSDELGPLYGITKDALEDEIWSVQAVVILLGANDLKQDYDDVFNNTEGSNFFTGMLNRLNSVYAWVNTSRGTARPKIVVCTVPDIGAAPEIADTYDDPDKQEAARAKIAVFNQSILTWAAGKNYPPSIARLDLLTDRIFDETPFSLNGTGFTLSGDDDNPPDQVFCRDGFHVSTVGQALVANEILAALADATGNELTPFGNREILEDVLGLDPDQPYLDYVAAAGLAGSGPDEDPDGDGIPNLAEFLLDTPPGTAGQPLSGSFVPGGTLAWKPSATAAAYGVLVPEESPDLTEWTPVPGERIDTAADGTVSIVPATGDKGFARLRAEVTP
ncbi:SGNH/GDSL hydrolase family protein [Luteolibacter marinus]|uniref:SGNH/GDSL hydrolase family protein n=1 Tax=Luteolibacter marinus TaxID=2776705 RepID=UPI0018687769|nr:SGNH/GDSL hydrolase family protein [Luteolibacter marinus]